MVRLGVSYLICFHLTAWWTSCKLTARSKDLIRFNRWLIPLSESNVESGRLIL